MKLKRTVLLILAIIMLASVAACSGTDGSTQDTAAGTNADRNGNTEDRGAPIELIIYTQLANYSGLQIGWAAEVLKERFNVVVTIIPEMEGTFATRTVEGFLGDIVIFGSDGREYREAISAGLLLDWEEDEILPEYGPYINDNMRLALEKNRKISRDGHVYGFGHNVAGNAEDRDTHIYYPYLRWDLYEKLGKPPINTLEDFIPILAEMQKLEPQSDVGTKTYGVSSYPDWDGDMVMMVKSTGALYGWEEFAIGLYHVIDQVFQGALEPDGMYLRCLKFYNTLYQMGLYDPDSMTQTFEDAARKYKNGVSFWNIFTFVAETFNTDEHLDAGKAMKCVPAADQKNVVTGLNVFGMNRVWTIGANSNYPELCMEIINWFCTPEGVMTYNYGPQGVTWDYDENGNTYLTDAGFQSRRDKKSVVIKYGDWEGTYEDGEFQHNNTTWSVNSVNPESALGETFFWESWESTMLLQPVRPIEVTWREWAGAIRADVFLDQKDITAVAVGTQFAFDKRSNELELAWKQVTDTIKQGSWRAIYADNDDDFAAIVDQMIKDAKAFGYDDCVEWIEGQALMRKAAEDEARGKNPG